MRSIQEFVKLSGEEKNSLKQNYIKKLENRGFRELVNMLPAEEELLMQYTSSLEDASLEFSNCKGCKGLEECKNKVKGYLYMPKVIHDKVCFSYVSCSY